MTTKTVYSSSQLGALDDAGRFDAWTAWRARMNRGWIFGRNADPFHARIETKILGGLEISRVRGSLSTAERDQRLIASDNDNRFAIGFAIKPCRFYTAQVGRETVHDGGVAVVSMGDPARLGSSGPTLEWIRIMMPAEPLVARAPGVEDLLARPLHDAEGAFKLLAAYAVFALDNDDVGGTLTGELAANHCIDLAALAFGARGDAAEAASRRGLGAVRLARVLGRIRRDYAQPGLSAAGVARDLGLSERYVHRLLQDSGRGFAERVLDLRLEAASALLARHPTRRVGDIAYGVGFSDLSYFNRCFRRRYGLTPTAARGG